VYTFRFLNESGSLSELGWDGAQRTKLWRYNQHYFDYLNSFGADARVDAHCFLVSDWIKENPPGHGTGWESYPLSLRIVNWIKWYQANHSLHYESIHSLTLQARWLERRVEWHILGNHLFANAKALIFAGLCFEGQEAQNWLMTGLKIVSDELTEQVLDDGGNFERSPMYHALFLEDLLDLINLARRYPGVIESELINRWCATARLMLYWLEGMCHPDGEIAFFNDAAVGIAPSPDEIKNYSYRLGILNHQSDTPSPVVACTQFLESGYLRLTAKNAVLFMDVAPIGPDYLPGHAHADTLSLELSLFGWRVLVNGGTSQYGDGALRQEERGTAAHNTVEVDGNNSSEVWSGFRVARRAYPQGLEVIQGDQYVSVTCAHDGYTRWPTRAVHARTLQLSQGKLRVMDQIIGKCKTAVARFHFHPDFQIDKLDVGEYSLSKPGFGQVILITVLHGVAGIEPSFYSPEFGIRQKSHCLAVQIDSKKQVIIEMSWSIDE